MELKPEIERFSERCREAVRVQPDLERSGYWCIAPNIEVPDDLSVMVSDTMFNQRCALDYLVYALAEFDSKGVPQEDTQFPIANSPTNFRGAIGAGRLRGLSKEHVAAIEDLQPYDGRDDLQWLRVLREFSNAQKHRHLDALALTLDVHFERGDWTHRSLFDLLASTQRWMLAARRRPLRSVTQTERGETLQAYVDIPPHLRDKMDVEFEFTVHVAFWQGPPVVEALELFQTQTRALVSAFEPEFEGA